MNKQINLWAAFLSLAPLCPATIISTDFGPAGNLFSGSAVAPTSTAAPVWNSFQPNNGNSLSNLQDENGAIVAGVTFQLRSPNNVGTVTQPDNGNGRNEPQFRQNSLLTDYAFDNSNPADERALNFTLGGLDANLTYNLWLYGGAQFFSENQNTQTITIDGLAQTQIYDAVAAANDGGTPGDITDDTTNFVEGNNYLVFQSITGVTEITGTIISDGVEPTLSGFQLQAVPEPSTAILGLLGATVLLRRRR